MAAKPTSLISIVLLADASLTVAEEWHCILSDFVNSITQRLATEIHPESEMRMGYIAYGAPDEPQGPIVGQRFFQDPQTLLQDLSTKNSDMGIGCASGTGPDGLSALDGYACALEMFDLQRHTADFQPLKPITLNVEKEQSKTFDRHDYIIHVAGAETDGATQPRFNDSVALDELNWGSLPSEISKRKLHICMNLLRPVQQFVDFFNAVSDGARSTPWFSLPPNHTILLYGFPAPRSKPKRLSDVERSPAQKRPRIKDASSPSSPTKAASGNSPYMPAAAVKTPKQPPATVAKAPTPTTPLQIAEPKSTPTLSPAQQPIAAVPAPAPPPTAHPPPIAQPPPTFSPPVTITPAPPALAARPPNPLSFLGRLGFYQDIQPHPQFEAGLKNPQQRLLVEHMLKYDPVYIQQFISVAQARKQNPNAPNLAARDAQVHKLRQFLELGAAALRRWNTAGVPALFNDIKNRASMGAQGAPPPAAPPPQQQQQQQQPSQSAPNPSFAPHTQDIMDQMNEISKSDIQRRNMLPPSTPGGRPPSLPAFSPQQPGHLATPTSVASASPAQMLAQQNARKWAGTVLVQVGRPGQQAQSMRLEIVANHQAASDPLMGTWPPTIEMRIMYNMTIATKDLEAWIHFLRNRQRVFSIVRFQLADVPNPIVKEQMRQALIRIIEGMAARSCIAVATWPTPSKGPAPAAIFIRSGAGPTDSQLLGVVFPHSGFDRNDMPQPPFRMLPSGPQQQQQQPNLASMQPQQQQPGPVERPVTANEEALAKLVTTALGVPWEAWRMLPGPKKAELVQRYMQMTSKGQLPPGPGPGASLQMLQQHQQRLLQQQQMQAALLARGGAPGGGFAGLTATAGSGFAGMGGGGANPGMAPSMNVGALGGMQPQNTGAMGGFGGGGFPVSQDQINSWMQRTSIAPGGNGG